MTARRLASFPLIPAAVAIGRAAGRALSANTGGRVLAVFSRGCYLQATDGKLACVGLPSLGRGPLNVIVDALDCLDRLRPGGEWRRCDNRIVINRTTAFSLPAGAPWQPPRLPVRSPPREEALTTLTMFASRRAPAFGLGRLIAPLLLDHEIVVGADSLLRAAAGPLEALRNWVSSDVRREQPARAVDLLGLGPGLTPSGDDALGGALIALQAYGRAHAARELSQVLGASAATVTGTISRAHLACAIAGEGHETLHMLLAALASAGPEAIIAATERVTAIGQSSGWDTMAGVAAVLAGLSRSADERHRQRRCIGV